MLSEFEAMAERLNKLRAAVLAYDAAIRKHAKKGHSYVEGPDLDSLYSDMMAAAGFDMECNWGLLE